MAIAAAVPAPAGSATPGGPRLASTELIETKGSERREGSSPPLVAITATGQRGGRRERLLGAELDADAGVAPLPFFAPSWSPDGRLIAFVGARGKTTGIYVMRADGADARLVAGTRGGRSPVIAPGGQTIAFARSRSPGARAGHRGASYSSTTIWLVGTGGGRPRRVTAWGKGIRSVPGAFYPDGSVLLLTRRDREADGPSIVALDMASGALTEVEPLASEPAISPDGTKLAFVGYGDSTRIETEEDHDYDVGELYTASIDGTGVERLTRNRKIESSPSWDPSGRRLAYVRTKADTSFVPGLALLFPFGNEIREMNADGTCDRKVRSSRRVALYGVAWEPGAHRGAGPVEC